VLIPHREQCLLVGAALDFREKVRKFFLCGQRLALGSRRRRSRARLKLSLWLTAPPGGGHLEQKRRLAQAERRVCESRATHGRGAAISLFNEAFCLTMGALNC